MWLSIILVMFVIFSETVQLPLLAAKDVDGSDIISGRPAKAGQFPWQVANKFLTPSGELFCGGALICDQWVLTAAHCTYGATQFKLLLGSINHKVANEEGRVTVISKNAIVHPQYNLDGLANDVALIKLPHPVEFTERIQPIPLGNQYTPDGTNLTVSGWGKTTDSSNTISNTLNYVSLRTISNDKCALVYKSAFVTNSTICCESSPQLGICHGDSGGPLIGLEDNKYVHVGVVSYMHPAGCALGYPSGHGRTVAHRDWIFCNRKRNVYFALIYI